MADADREFRLTRRSLLRLGALAGGGLALGICVPASAAEAADGAAASAAAPSGQDSALAPNAWIRIHSDGRIRLALARSEMGQGVTTALPMLIAEELEVGLDQLQVEPAPVGKAYVNRLLGEQATGGSTSVRDAWPVLREAGAAVRLLLIQAAAQRWGVPVSECSARRGRVHHADGVRELAYAELASAAAALPLPESVPLKSADAWGLIGTSQRRLDVPDKVIGAAAFGLDVRLPRMLYASIVPCSVVGGTLADWSAGAARKVPGVVDVVAVRRGVAVVAKTSWAALSGRERLKVACRPAPGAEADSERIRARFRKALTGRAAIAQKTGDVSAALDGARHHLEAVYELPFQAHACMEPMNCTADVGRDRCAIHVPTQAQGGALQTARRITGLSADRISVHTTLLGGGFGRRREQDFVEDAVELSRRLRRPVQVIWTREDDLTQDFYHPMTAQRLRGGVDDQGRLTAWFHRVVGPSLSDRLNPARIRDGIDPMMMEGALDLPYAIPHRRVEYRRADIRVPTGPWRGGGHSHTVFAVECFIDELARAAGVEPLQFRRGLLAGRPRHLSLLDLIADRADWAEPVPAGRARGLAFMEAFGSLIAAVAEVSAESAQPRVHRVVCALDCGQMVNPDTVRSQIESGVVFGLTAALKGEIRLTDGRVEQRSFADYPLLRFDEMPEILVHPTASDAEPGGVSDLATPVIGPAVANALLALTGQPVRRLPIRLG